MALKRSCPLCGRRLTPSIRTKDHFIPKSLGGTGAPSNTWPLCKPCNNRKGNRMPNEIERRAFERYQDRFCTVSVQSPGGDQLSH